MQTPPLENYFSDKRIVRILCNRRIRSTRQRRKANFFNNVLAAGTYRHKAPDKIAAMLPPRRRWPRPGKSRRDNADSDLPAETATALCNYVLHCLRDETLVYPWLTRLREFTSRIRSRATTWNERSSLAPPLLKLQPSKKGDFTSKCRAISEYPLEDAILCSSFAAYLRDAIDIGLDPNCFAFRPSRGPGKSAPTFHDAIRKLRDFRATFAIERDLWVAECDIQGFYDAVSHDVVRAEVRAFFERHHICVDARLLFFLESSLASYSYNEYARPRAVQELLAKGVRKPKLSDPLVLLLERGITPSQFHGIPQGSAFSCILANLVLSRADREVRQILESNWLSRDGIYLRYCDDIVIVDPNHARCVKAIKQYESTLDELKLPYHPSKSLKRYGRTFWKHKSKSPYRWSCVGKSRKASPWLAFVGYQIHRDGTTRIRKSSIDNEVKKQREAVAETLRLLADRIRQFGVPHIHNSVSYRTMMHLIAIAVGHPASGKIAPATNGVGWATGFEALREDRIDPTGLRRLDRSRTAELQRQKRHLWRLQLRGRIKPVRPPHSPKKVEVQFAGPPFSYYWQYRNYINIKPKLAFRVALMRSALRGLDTLMLALGT